MFKQMVQNVAGSDIYMISSLLIFVIFFVMVSIRLYRTDNETIREISNIPLNDDQHPIA